MFSLASSFHDNGDQKNEQSGASVEQAKSLTLTYSYPKSEPNLPSAFVFPRGANGEISGQSGSSKEQK